MSDPYMGREIAGQFRIVQRIGSGGMGAVYRAEQVDMNRFVAIKILHSKYLPRADLVSRFRREARAMSHLSHPNTARVFLHGQLEDGACYFVMEYLEGCNLAQVVRDEGPIEPGRAIHIMVQVCGALEEAHRMGIIHRDLKPENIFLTCQGGIEDFPKVLDFGLAKVTERQMRPDSLILTRKGMVFGTPEFMSPEQARGKTLDARSDIYSLGMISYEMLTGKLPFDAKQPMEYINHHLNTSPIPLGERAPQLHIPAGLDAALMRALAKEPAYRFETAALFAQALQSCDEEPWNAHPTGMLPARPSTRETPTFVDGDNDLHPNQKESPWASSEHPEHVRKFQLPRGFVPSPASNSFSSMLPWIVFVAGLILAVGGVVALVLALNYR
ncbi:MAG: serine/threonine-protein kinase [Myxococcota bacterium]